MEFLVGTILLATLGFDLVQTKQDGRAISLLECHEIPSLHPIVTPSRTETENNDQQLEINNYNVTVRLLLAVKIPARHSWLVHVKADKSDCDHLMLFEEQKDESDSMVLTVENHSLQPVMLEKGLEIGCLELVQLVPADSGGLAVTHTDEVEISQDNEEAEVWGRKEKLLSEFDVEESLIKVERSKLNCLITKFHDVFALDTTELGHTNAVQHIIDTGTHQPI